LDGGGAKSADDSSLRAARSSASSWDSKFGSCVKNDLHMNDKLIGKVISNRIFLSYQIAYSGKEYTSYIKLSISNVAK
jgi:hypothetical protein